MSIAFVSFNSSGANTWNATPSTSSTASGVATTAGNLIIAVAANVITSIPTFSDTSGGGNVWNTVTTGGAGFYFAWTIAKVTNGGFTVQINYSSTTFTAVLVRQYTGHDLLHPIDAVTVAASGSGTTASANPITTLWNNEALIEIIVGSNGAVTPMAGFSNQGSAVTNVSAADKIVSTKQSAFVCTWTQASAAWQTNSISIVAKGQRSPSGIGNLGCSLLLGVG